MACNGVRVVLVQAQEVTAYRGLELTGLDLVRDVRLVRAGVTTLRAGGFAAAGRTESTLATTTVRSAPAGGTAPVVAATST